ncbi:MAG: PHP domain-containing protein [Christensenellaceae bacterium]
MRADMHVHTVYSDGWHTPEEIARIAKRKGIGLIVFTDHDVMEDALRKREALRREGILSVDGIEVSAYEDTKIHVTGYGLDPFGEAYRAFSEARGRGSELRAEDTIRKFNALGIPVTMEAALKERKEEGIPLHTIHIARAVHRLGVGRDEGEVYEQYMTKGKAAYSDLGRPTPEEAIRMIHAGGGVASLAHPGRIEKTREALIALVGRLVSVGLDGIEAVYTTHTAEETEFFSSLAAKYGLFVTGGSDTHREGFRRAIGEPYFEPTKELMRALRL